MRILFVASEGRRDEVSPVIYNQYQSLINLKVEIDIFSLKSGIKNYFLGIFKLKRYLKPKRYDIIHAHYGWCGIVALFAKKKEKLVVSFMGDDLIGTVGKNNKYTTSSKIIAKLNLLLAKHFCDFCIIKSQNLLNVLNTVPHVEKIANGVNNELFLENNREQARKKIGFNLVKKYILFVSNPNRTEKNFDLAIKSVNSFNDKTVELITILNIKNNELVHYYNAANCLILTSFHEGSPNVIKEAMACNCPIVSTNVGDVKWVFGDTEGCYLTSFDPEDFAYKIKKALKFSEEKGRTKGREQILKLGLDSETIAKKIIKIYNKVLIEK